MAAAPEPSEEELVPRPAAGRIFEGARAVRLGDVSPGGRLRLDAAVRYLQDVSADDTADAALPDDQAWVVRRTIVEVQAFPRYLEPLALATWCSGTGSHYAERRVSIEGARGGRIDAATVWVQFDPASGRPKRIGPDFDAIYAAAAGGRRIRARLVHPGPPADVASAPWPLRVTDLDVLGHVNNAAYWEVVEEALVRRRDLRAPLRATLEHRIAIERGATVEVVTEDGPDRSLSVWILADGTVAGSARLVSLSS